MAGVQQTLRIVDKVALIKAELGLEGSAVKDVITEANEQLGQLPSQGMHALNSRALLTAMGSQTCMHVVVCVRARVREVSTS